MRSCSSYVELSITPTSHPFARPFSSDIRTLPVIRQSIFPAPFPLRNWLSRKVVKIGLKIETRGRRLVIDIFDDLIVESFRNTSATTFSYLQIDAVNHLSANTNYGLATTFTGDLLVFVIDPSIINIICMSTLCSMLEL